MWKTDWEQTKRRHIDWWERKGFVFSAWGNGYAKTDGPWVDVPVPPPAPDTKTQWSDPAYVAAHLRADMARRVWPVDMLPVAWPDIGTVSLAAYLGAIPEYGLDNVWYKACIDDPDNAPPLVFDPSHPEVIRLESVVKEAVALSKGDYLVGMPAIISNMDVLAELRGAGELLLDLIDRPDWVKEKLADIHTVWETAWERMYHLVRAGDNSMAFGYFMLWGKGRTGLLQCDVSANFSPDMFGEFVLPGLERECAFLDHSLYHLDGHQCICHLDHVLSVKDLDAVEWTPDPKVPTGGSAHWFPMYRKIRDAGKALWLAGVTPEELRPLLDAIGTDGLYLTVNMDSAREFEAAFKLVEAYR